MINRSYCIVTSKDFEDENIDNRIISELTAAHTATHSLEEPQLYAWNKEIEILKQIASRFDNCTIAFEYMIPRMGKRVDAVVLINNYLFIVEFKIGERNYPQQALNQVLDYSFDLANFHKQSHNCNLYPILVCDKAKARSNNIKMVDPSANIYNIQFTNEDNFASIIDDIVRNCVNTTPYFKHSEWLNSIYSPTPTIIEAAQALYHNNSVEDISRNEAGLTNIAKTTNYINKIIDKSKHFKEKSICFITGVPGAGKTLVGLNLASIRKKINGSVTDETAVFLSGNGPLIDVLQASLTEDQMARNKEACNKCSNKSSEECKKCIHKQPKYVVSAEVESFVQGVHLFREELFISENPPHEHIAIFDEAQRAWSEKHLNYKMKTRRRNRRIVNKSEPECLIEYMDRHEDWACIVCLVGGGQEIYRGEAGISEWFKALNNKFTNWNIYVSDAINSDNYLGEDKVQDIAPKANIIKELHLAVDMRSFRNKNVADFAEAIITNKPESAKELYKQLIYQYPIYVTRDLDKAKRWAKHITKRPSDRYGIVADSYGQRIRADGVIVPLDFNAVKWFLRGKDEIDSSYFMEIAASEFDIQGLEIDYAIIAWEADYRYKDGEFNYHQFRGGKWQNVHSPTNRKYLENGYRVLLTRARQGYVIYVPMGSEDDITRPPRFYDQTYEYLLSSGIKEL